MENSIRRHVLQYLDETDGSVELATLAAAVAESADGRNRDRIALELHHNHLPKLADTGFVEYDHRANVVVGTLPAWTESYLNSPTDC